MAGLTTERNSSRVMQAFAPFKIVTATTLDVATHVVSAYCVSADTTYQINGSGPSMPIQAGAVRAVPPSVTSIVFATEVNIEVM